MHAYIALAPSQGSAATLPPGLEFCSTSHSFCGVTQVADAPYVSVSSEKWETEQHCAGKMRHHI